MATEDRPAVAVRARAARTTLTTLDKKIPEPSPTKETTSRLAREDPFGQRTEGSKPASLKALFVTSFQRAQDQETKSDFLEYYVMRRERPRNVTTNLKAILDYQGVCERPLDPTRGPTTAAGSSLVEKRNREQ